jgi:CHASE2 domain-containing sensor protein
MAGARIHAQLVDTLLSGRHVRRLAGAWGAWSAAAALGLLALLTGRRAGAFHLVAWAAIAGALLAGGIATFVLFDGLVLDVGPALAVLACVLVVTHLYARAAEGP